MGHTPCDQGTRPFTGQGVLGSDGIRVKVEAQKEQRGSGGAAASFEQRGAARRCERTCANRLKDILTRDIVDTNIVFSCVVGCRLF